MSHSHWDLPHTLGALRRSNFSEEKVSHTTVKAELRANLMRKLQSGEPLFPGIVGYEDTVTPQIVNALLARHNFILLGLRAADGTQRINPGDGELVGDDDVVYMASSPLLEA